MSYPLCVHCCREKRKDRVKREREGAGATCQFGPLFRTPLAHLYCLRIICINLFWKLSLSSRKTGRKKNIHAILQILHSQGILDLFGRYKVGKYDGALMIILNDALRRIVACFYSSPEQTNLEAPLRHPYMQSPKTLWGIPIIILLASIIL